MGAEGVEGLQAGDQVLIADDPQGFADAVMHVLDDRSAAARLSAAGRVLASAYDWAVIAPRLAAVYQDLCQK
jgi:glycosyltransferase involved in cell wall biosynthesis